MPLHTESHGEQIDQHRILQPVIYIGNVIVVEPIQNPVTRTMDLATIDGNANERGSDGFCHRLQAVYIAILIKRMEVRMQVIVLVDIRWLIAALIPTSQRAGVSLADGLVVI